MLIVTSSTDPAYIEANAQPMVMYQNLLATATITNSTLPTTAPRANAVNESTFDYWQPTAVPDTLRMVAGASQAADGAFFAAHTLGTAGATLTVQYYDGATWQTQASYSPTSNKPFGFIWPSRSATAWGIQISGAVAQVGVVWIGPRLVIPGGVTPGYVPIWAARRIEKYAGVSRRGQFFGQRIERAGARLQPNFMDVPYSYALTTLSGFRDHYNEGKAFVWASAPGVFPDDAAYVWAPDDAMLESPIRAGGIWCGLSMSLEAYVE
jgi:hypothetical protein